MKRDREEIMQHRNDRLDEDQVVQALRSLPRLRPPAKLNSSLRVIASREVQRLVRGRSLTRMDRFRLSFDNLMRPLALPFAGGVFSAVILFSMWVVPSYPVRASSTFDVP